MLRFWPPQQCLYNKNLIWFNIWFDSSKSLTHMYTNKSHSYVFKKSFKVHTLYFEISTFRQMIICFLTMVSIKEIGQFVSNDNTYIPKLYGFFYNRRYKTVANFKNLT